MSIVITGTPGVGKHTVSQLISQKLKIALMDINRIAKEKGFFEEDDGVLEIDTKKAKKYFITQNLEEKVVVGHLAPYVLDECQVKVVIVLRKNPYHLVPIYKKRGYTDKKTRDNTGSEILGVIMHDAKKGFPQKKVFQIDVTKKSVAQITKEIMAVLEGNDCKNDATVDWLDLISKNNDLEKFFAD